MNAQIVFMLQSYLDRLDGEVDDLRRGLSAHGASAMPIDSPAIFKVMLYEELMVLRRRIEDLGGPAGVLKMSKADIAKLLTGPKIAGTPEEQQSYYARTIATTPLTALMTDDEINKLASRLLVLEEAHRVHRGPTAMLEPLKTAQGMTTTPSRTPTIPGVNAPKQHLGSAPHAGKEGRTKIPAGKKKVIVLTSESEQVNIDLNAEPEVSGQSRTKREKEKSK